MAVMNDAGIYNLHCILLFDHSFDSYAVECSVRDISAMMCNIVCETNRRESGFELRQKYDIF